MKPQVDGKAIAALKKCEQSPCWRRAGVIIVVHPDKPGKLGKIKIAFPADGAGRLHAFAWDTDGTGVQYGSASGYGYDKLSAALSGMMWDGERLTDHPNNWEMRLRERGYQIIWAL